MRYDDRSLKTRPMKVIINPSATWSHTYYSSTTLKEHSTTPHTAPTNPVYYNPFVHLVFETMSTFLHDGEIFRPTSLVTRRTFLKKLSRFSKLLRDSRSAPIPFIGIPLPGPKTSLLNPVPKRVCLKSCFNTLGWPSVSVPITAVLAWDNTEDFV